MVPKGRNGAPGRRVGNGDAGLWDSNPRPFGLLVTGQSLTPVAKRRGKFCRSSRLRVLVSACRSNLFLQWNRSFAHGVPPAVGLAICMGLDGLCSTSMSSSVGICPTVLWSCLRGTYGTLVRCSVLLRTVPYVRYREVPHRGTVYTGMGVGR